MSLTILYFIIFIILVLALGASVQFKKRPAMSLERERITRLRDQGKISPQEAIDLLSALGGTAIEPVPLMADSHLRLTAYALILFGLLAGGVVVPMALSAGQKISQFRSESGLMTEKASPTIASPEMRKSQMLIRLTKRHGIFSWPCLCSP